MDTLSLRQLTSIMTHPSPVTDNCPTWISGREIISVAGGSNPRPPEYQSELPRPIKIKPRMYVKRSIMYENVALCSPEEYSSVTR